MPNLDLGPNEYARDNKGRWVRGVSKRWARNWALIGIAMLVAIFFTRDQIHADTLFGLTAIISLCTGMAVALWLKDLP